MLAERRDFTVATYSSTRGTGVRFTVCVLTGRGCGAGCFASVLLHPEVVRTMKPKNPIKRTTISFLNLTILKRHCCITDACRTWPDSICVLTGIQLSAALCTVRNL